MLRSVLQPSQQKLAENLTILHDCGIGMLTRLYNIKKRVFCFMMKNTKQFSLAFELNIKQYQGNPMMEC
uniref:Uncharacterized protein n=1 Tax=Sphaerodactylus townsendi TaxID=933632 RepID=A0ACB8ELE6_9SAUR